MRSTTSSHPHRGTAGLLAVLAALILLASACDVPAKPAGTLFDAWKANDTAKAHTVASNTAVTSLFARTYKPADQWFFNRCDGAAGSTYCTWINIVETRLQMRITNSTAKVTEVTYIPLTSGVSGHFFHDWRVGDRSNAGHYGTASGVNQMFAMTYHANVHWMPDGCEGAAGSIYCTWFDDAANKLVTHLDNVSTHKVIGVAYTPHA